MKDIFCPDCSFILVLPEDSTLKEIVVCPGCGLEFEIISVNPILLQQLVIEGEDFGE